MESDVTDVDSEQRCCKNALGKSASVTVVCRLCAHILSTVTATTTPSGNPSSSDDEIYVHLLKIVGKETVSSIIRKCLPETILVSCIPEEKSPVICINCYKSLLDLLSFYDKICKGQEKLQRLEKELALSGNEIPLPRRRGRPRKGESGAKPVPVVAVAVPRISTIELELSNADQKPIRSNRSSREPGAVDSLASISSSSSHANQAGTENASFEVTNVAPVKQEEIQTEFHIPTDSREGQEERMIYSDDELALTENISADVTVTMSNIRQQNTRGRRRGRPRTIRPFNSSKYKCDKCGVTYPYYTSLIYHKVSAHHEKTKQEFKCSLCDKVFKLKGFLVNHMFTHDDSEDLKDVINCEHPNCQQTFKTRGAMRHHVRNIHLRPAKQFTCETCGVQLSSKGSLKSHIRIHNNRSDGKRFTCHTCDKVFYHRGNFKEHIRTHTKEKPYLCIEAGCGKSFTTSSTLKSHRLIHSTATSYICGSCGKSFNTPGALKIHMARHTSEEEEKECSVCNKKFKDRWSLRKHVRIHSGDKKYECSLCKRTFTDSSNYSKHMRRIHSMSIKPAIAQPHLNNTEDVKSSAHMNKSEPLEIQEMIGDDLQNPHPASDVTAEAKEVSTSTLSNDTLIQILNPEEAFRALIPDGTSVADGNIIYLYPSNASEIFAEPLLGQGHEDH